MSPQSRYTILRKIADGGTAEIFLGKQAGASGFEKLVVLKRIFNTFYSDPQFRHMLVDEAHIAMSLYHSNIVQVLDLGEDDGRHFLALELVDGWTLDGVLKRAKAANFPFPPALALYVTAEVCRALAYAHSKSLDGQPLGIVHRDVSPQNVLLSEHGEVKLTDFGIAKGRTKHEQSLGHVIKGKIGFMSPEQAHGHELDARSDLFSLGVVLYLMITRQPPFDAPTDYETLMQVRAGDFVPPETARPRLNREVYRVIRKAMANAPSDRYQNATEMLVDVEHVMRVGFRALGQTELARWLSDLSGRDGVPPLTRAQPPPIESVVSDHAPITTASTLATPPPSSVSTRSGVESSADSSVELDLTDVVLVSPLPFWNAATFRKRARWATGVVLLLALVVTALKIVRSHERVTSASSLRERRAMTSSATESSSVAAPASAAASVARTPTLPAPTTVSIQSDPDGIQVRRGQRMFGVTPMSIKLRPGSYRLTFTKPGYVPTNKTVLVPRSGRRSIHVSLRRARAHKPGRTEPMSAGSEDTVWHFSR